MQLAMADLELFCQCSNGTTDAVADPTVTADWEWEAKATFLHLHRKASAPLAVDPTGISGWQRGCRTLEEQHCQGAVCCGHPGHGPGVDRDVAG